MKRLLVWIVLIGIAAGGGAVGYRHWHATPHDNYRTETVCRGEVTFVLKENGTVQPVLSVQVGSFVSGPLCRVCADFNDKVKKGQLLAEIDPLIFKANVGQATAQLLSAQANLLQAQAKLHQAKREWNRAQELLPKKAIADTDYDLTKSNYESALASVAVSEAQIKQNEATLSLAKANLGYTKILSPVDGIVTDRKVDPGQTLASAYQTPVLFVVAPDLEKRVYVLASVDEADIGLIRDAQRKKQPVTFSVEAYPKDKFEGRIRDIRLTPTTVQNIVTYTVVVEAPNLGLKLLPGMTPTLSFQIEKRTSVLRIPNSALRFVPKPEQVRPSDRSILDGKLDDKGKTEDKGKAASSGPRLAEENASPEATSKEQHVWVADGDLLAAVKITTGLEGNKFTEIVTGDLHDGQAIVTGTKTH